MARVTISPATREHIRETHAELREARARADSVERPDGTDETGHPGLRAANLEGYLGRYTLPLLEALEAAEARLTAFEDPGIQVAGVPARLTAHASIEIEGLPEPIELPLELKAPGAFPRGFALVIDARPALAALADAEEAGKKP